MYAYRPAPRRFPWLLVIGLVFAVSLVVVFAVFWLSGAFASSSDYHPFFGFWGGFFLLFLLLWIGFFVVRMVFWSRGWRNRGGGYARPDPAVMMARRRYARGEITREQYDQIMNDLERRRPNS